MGNVKISEIADELGYDSKEIIQKAQEMGFKKIQAKTHVVSDEEAAAIYEYIQTGILPQSATKPKAPKAEKSAKPKEKTEEKSAKKSTKDEKPAKDKAEKPKKEEKPKESKKTAKPSQKVAKKNEIKAEKKVEK
ncbi:MAG: translation initiation factor IF-2 N-terminal domain-containing protein, partial [Campylobacter sp.]|nr:translation initiation factor IF-2 N-terminal domain-containing protein [Campylobacter sp.]